MWYNREKLGKMHVQTQLQAILATYCVEHKERAYLQPNQFRVWIQRVFPADNQPKSKNTVFYSVLAKRFELELKTARMAFSDLAPSKEETSLGTAYRHLEIVPFPERLRTPPADRLDPSPEDIEGYDAWLFLKENANRALETLNWTPDMLKGWLEESDFAVKKPALQENSPTVSATVFYPSTNPMSPFARLLTMSLRKTRSPVLCPFHARGLRCCTCRTMITVHATVGMR